MRYPKPALTFEQQADLLLTRGLTADRNELIERLSVVNYYRLSAYWYTLRLPDETLQPGTTLDDVWKRYVFDRQLRVLVMDAIERVEVAIRTQAVTRFTLDHGPFGYLDRVNLKGLSVGDHQQFLIKIRREATRSQEDYVKHFFQTYTSETDLPLWIACELMTFGHLYTLFRGLPSRAKKAVAKEFGVHAPVLTSWLRALNQVRNICAHHARLWNRVLGVKPLIPEKASHARWHEPVAIGSERMFGIMTILHYMLLRVAPQSRWRQRMDALFDQYVDIPKNFMGFPDDWQDSPLWK